MRYFHTAVCGALLCGSLTWIAGTAIAQEAPVASEARPDQAPVVVELFTSQGCVSCPPADVFFAELVKDPRVIALSLHVDYWDYIGWKDNFGNPAFTERQKRYAKAIKSRTIYTPQFVIAGQDRIEGFDPLEISESLVKHLMAPPQVALQAERQGDRLVISAQSPAAFDVPVQVELVRYLPQQTVAIETGENAGQTITYHNVVTSWQTVAEWGGAEPLQVIAPLSGPEAGVVMLQKSGPAEVLAARKIE